MNIPPSEHVIWSLLRVAILMAALTAILFLTASNFDATEIRTIVLTFLFAAGTEGTIKTFVGGIKGKSDG